MSLHIYTQEEFDALPVVGGWKQCPSGDYSRIRVFPERCRFGEECRFGARCSFGAWCSFGEGCSFGAWCRFGEGCSFGEECIFGARCSFDGHMPDNWETPFFAVDRIGSKHRKAYFFRFGGIVYIRAGCFFGDENAFRQKLAKDADARKTRHYLAALELARDVLTPEGEAE